MNMNNDVYFVQYGDISQKYETLEKAIEASRTIARLNLGGCINILKLVGYTQSPAPAIQTIVFKDEPLPVYPN
jgi:hypothetical protein